MNVEVVVRDTITLLRPNMDIRAHILDTLRSVMESVLLGKRGGDGSYIVMDCSDVQFIDSSGIGLLLSFARQCSDRDHLFALCNYSEDIREIFDIIGANAGIPLFGTIEELKETLSFSERVPREKL